MVEKRQNATQAVRGNGQRPRQVGGKPVGQMPGGPGPNSKSKKHFRPYHSINVPRRVDLETEVDATAVTTIMLRNIPNRYTQTSLIEEINGVGFEGRYDFFYLPMDVHNRTNVGYAFINFVTPQDATDFLTAFGNYMFKRHSSHKIAGVSPAHMQGLVKNIQHFLPRAVTQSRDACYRPAVFLNGRRLELQEALDELQQPPAAPKAAGPPGLLSAPPGIGIQSGAPSKAAAACDDLVGFPYKPAPGLSSPYELAPGLSSPYEAFVRGTTTSTAAESQFLRGASEDSSGFVRGVSGGSWESDLNPLAAAYAPVTTARADGNDGWQDEAFVGARLAFENALSSLLQDPLALAKREPATSDTVVDTTVSGSRTGTPRSSGSSADERAKLLNSTPGAGRKVLQSDLPTPRTDKQLLGLNFSLTTN